MLKHTPTFLVQIKRRRNKNSPQESEQRRVLPIDLFASLSRVLRQRVINGNTRDLASTQMVEHVVHSLELLLQVVGFEGVTFAGAHLFFDGLPAQASVKRKDVIINNYTETLYLQILLCKFYMSFHFP